MRTKLILATSCFWALAAAQDFSFLAQAQPPVPAVAPLPPVPPQAALAHWDREESVYRSGSRAIDKREYESAVEQFDRIVDRKSPRVDGALYWKAYAQNKLGRRDQALATLAQLQKEYPQSRWLNDAKALEVEVRQASGQRVSPDAESDEDLKLLAINALMSSDPDRALPLLQKVLGDAKASPRVKERALFVVAQNRDQRGRDILMSIAKGGANPDMQLKAVEYLGVFGRGNTQALVDIYTANSDIPVKRAVIRGLMMSGDSDRLLAIAKSEKAPELRKEAIRTLGTMKSERTGEALLSLYGSESDQSVKAAIVDGLFIQRNAKAMVDIARKEPDMSLKKEIVQRLATMRSKEATDYMLELLNK